VGIARLDATGDVRWMNDNLAIDGVEIDAVAEGEVRGRGDWDPPGDWRHFAIRLATGEAIRESAHGA
jgi:hypothetical protein